MPRRQGFALLYRQCGGDAEQGRAQTILTVMVGGSRRGFPRTGPGRVRCASLCAVHPRSITPMEVPRRCALHGDGWLSDNAAATWRARATQKDPTSRRCRSATRPPSSATWARAAKSTRQLDARHAQRRFPQRKALPHASLCQRHLCCDRIPDAGPGRPLFRRCAGDAERHPHIGQHVILRHALALVVHEAEHVLRRREALLRRGAIEAGAFLKALRHPAPVLVHEAEIGLRPGSRSTSANGVRIAAART